MYLCAHLYLTTTMRLTTMKSYRCRAVEEEMRSKRRAFHHCIAAACRPPTRASRLNRANSNNNEKGKKRSYSAPLFFFLKALTSPPPLFRALPSSRTTLHEDGHVLRERVGIEEKVDRVRQEGNTLVYASAELLQFA